MTPLIIIAVIVALAAIWFISVQRKLVSADEMCRNAVSQIGVQQESRWDSVTSLVSLTKSYNEHEYKTLTDVIGQRKEITRDSRPSEVEAQEQALALASDRIRLVAEQYPQLKASETYVKTMDSLNNYENQVRMSRMIVNDTVTKYNRIVRQFPSSIAASLLRFGTREYLKEPEGKTGMPDVRI